MSSKAKVSLQCFRSLVNHSRFLSSSWPDTTDSSPQIDGLVESLFPFETSQAGPPPSALLLTSVSPKFPQSSSANSQYSVAFLPLGSEVLLQTWSCVSEQHPTPGTNFCPNCGFYCCDGTPGPKASCGGKGRFGLHPHTLVHHEGHGSTFGVVLSPVFFRSVSCVTARMLHFLCFLTSWHCWG